MFRTLAATRALRALGAMFAGSGRFRREERQDAPAGPAGPDVMAMLGHELRTPLSALMGYTEMLAGADTVTEAQRRAWSASAHEAARQLNALIAAALENGARGLDAPAATRRPVDVDALAALCCDLARPDAAGRGVAIHFLKPADRAASVALCDPRAVRQILLNLLANAIRFTPPGGEVRVWADHDGGEVTLVVADNGIGMEAARLRQQAETGDARAGSLLAAAMGPGCAEGRGLGLTIVRSLASLQGGRLAIGPGERAGTVARVTLPEAAPDAAGETCAGWPGAPQMMVPCLA